jgi:hypothetical protein
MYEYQLKNLKPILYNTTYIHSIVTKNKSNSNLRTMACITIYVGIKMNLTENIREEIFYLALDN